MINALPSRPAQNDEATEPKADLLTYLNGAGEIIKSAISDFYWLASLMELAAGNQHENNALSLSTAAIIFGGLGAACTATGATYSHWQLNVNHQTPKGPNVDTEANTGQSLHLMQKTALLFDFVSHTGNVAGPIAFVVDILSKGNLSTSEKACVYGLSTLFGAFSSYAEVRTCRMNMKPPEQSEPVGLNRV